MLPEITFAWTADPQAWIALLTLTALELVLGIDNVVFIAILADKLPEEKRDRTRRIGIGLAAVLRIGLLFSIAIVMQLSKVLFTVFGHGFTGKDLVLIAGGLFLLAKATHEIHSKLEGEDDSGGEGKRPKALPSVTGVLIQILLLDLVFSIDSVVTAVGMVPADQVTVMIIAILLSVAVMMIFAKVISNFVGRHPTIKMLALSFLLLIGMALVADGTGLHIPKGYIYFAMGFSVFVEALNMRRRKISMEPIKLRSKFEGKSAS